MGAASRLPRASTRKHATKQVDRLLGNGKRNLRRLFASRIQFVISPRKELVIAMGWPEFDADD